MQYSKNASAHETSIAFHSGASLKRRCPYHAAVMKTLDANSSAIVFTLALLGDAERGLGQLVDHFLGHTEILSEQRGGVGGEPLREQDLLVVRVIEQDDELRRSAPELLDPVTEALRNEAHVPGAELRRFHPAMGAEDADAGSALRVVLPLVRVGMPVHLAQRAGLEVHPGAAERALNRELLRRDDALFPTREPPRRDRPQTILVGQLARLHIRAAEPLAGLRHLALDDVRLALDRKSVV